MRIRIRHGAIALALCVLCSACDSDSFSAPPDAASCTQIGSQCQLPSGPLGVCLEAPCPAGAKRPCFKCVGQH
jgi:hypothetical protein